MKSLWTVCALVALALPTAVQAQKDKAPKKERNRISREELAQAAERFGVLYDAVRNLRPHFVQANNRGPRTTGIGQTGVSGKTEYGLGGGGSNAVDATPTVYIDGVRSGEIEMLKSINTNAVVEVRYLSPAEAETELGPRNEGGAILVKLAKAEKP
jgi:hypothetical protein